MGCPNKKPSFFAAKNTRDDVVENANIPLMYRNRDAIIRYHLLAVERVRNLLMRSSLQLICCMRAERRQSSKNIINIPLHRSKSTGVRCTRKRKEVATRKELRKVEQSGCPCLQERLHRNSSTLD